MTDDHHLIAWPSLPLTLCSRGPGSRRDRPAPLGGKLADAVIELVVWVIFVETGRFVVAIISLGRWRGTFRRNNEERIYGAAGALSFRRDGTRIITTAGLCWIGFLFYCFLGIAIMLLMAG
ncbi:hypothetical protein [Pseudacidovorax intermedius]|uniref:hypothetical protein n=1 Tax=Pseudacidovorax intermedius TaxID=433924 RepID=UPI001E5FBDFF|nr:hypothetical protein [Pseudacidovorax intermedius]